MRIFKGPLEVYNSVPLQTSFCHSVRRFLACVLIGAVLSGCNGAATFTGEVEETVQNSIMLPSEPLSDQPLTPTPTPTPTLTVTLTPTLFPDLALPIAASSPGRTAADITDLILITGQSNALGAETDFDPGIDSPDNRVFAYTDAGWQSADLHQVWDRGWFPRSSPDTDPSNNFALHFGKKVVEIAPDRVVGFILITAPGESISHWRGDGGFFNEIRNKVSLAISELPSHSGVDAILWHQGESDGRDDDRYGSALFELISNFRGEGWFGSGKPFICGETASLPVNEQLRKLNTDNDDSTACVGGEGLPTKSDGMHFSADGLRAIGRLYGEKYIEMTNQ